MSVTFVTSTIIRARDQASATYGKIAASASRMERATRQARRAADAASRLAVRGATATGLAVAAASKTSLSVAKDFQSARNAVFARLPNSTADEQAKLQQQAKELGAVTSFSATQAANAQEAFAAAGRSVNEILESTPKALQLAAAESMELGDAAKIVTNTLNQFGLEVTETQRVVDVLARGSSLANTNVSQLGDALTKSGVSAKNFTSPLESTVAAILALQDTGVQASVAGNSLAKIITILSTPEGKSLEKLDELGLGISQFFDELENGDKAFKGFPNMLDALEKAGATNTDFNTLFGREFASAALALRGQQEKLLASEAALTNSGGSAAQAAATRLQGLPGVFASLASSWEAFNIALAESGALDFIVELLEKLTQYLRDLVNDPDRLREWAETFKTVATNIGLAAASLFVLSKSLNALKTAEGTIKLLGSLFGLGASGASTATALAKRVASNQGVQGAVGGAAAGSVASGGLGVGAAAAAATRAFPPAAILGILAGMAKDGVTGVTRTQSQRDQLIAESARLRAEREANKTAIADRFREETSVQVDIRLRGDGVEIDQSGTTVNGRGDVGTTIQVVP